jgi:hypothetical protein
MRTDRQILFLKPNILLHNNEVMIINELSVQSVKMKFFCP